jgi:hypothetical protein
MVDPLPKEFFTLQSMLTLSGATGSTFVVANGLQRAFNFNPRWLALAIAEAIVLLGVYASGGRDIIDYAIGVINGFLVYCSAAGATGVAGGGSGSSAVGRGIGVGIGTGRRSFLSSWF